MTLILQKHLGQLSKISQEVDNGLRFVESKTRTYHRRVWEGPRTAGRQGAAGCVVAGTGRRRVGSPRKQQTFLLLVSLCPDTQEEFALPARDHRVEASLSGWVNRLQQSRLAARSCPACTPGWTRQLQGMYTYRLKARVAGF